MFYRFLCICCCLPALTIAQYTENITAPVLQKTTIHPDADSTSLWGAFKKGKLSGQARYFFMHTQNHNKLSNYSAHALGTSLRFETAPYHGFRLGISARYIANIGSSDLGKADPLTNQYSRYEIGLFDITDPYNKTAIHRIEEAYLQWNHQQLQIQLGRQLLNTPFINGQDGRMGPNTVDGIWMVSKPFQHTHIEGGWLFALSPRSTTHAYRIGKSIGIYPGGIHPNGTPSQYAGNINSKGILMLGIHHSIQPNITLHVWDLFTENIFNTALLQVDWQHTVSNNHQLFGALQLIQQHALRNGGNSNPQMSYMEKGSQSLSFGTQFGWKNKQWESSLHYNRITAKGRYLMPREWGKDPFFTFLPRERNEGFGDVDAIVGKISRNIPKAHLKAALGFGYFHLPDVKNDRLNKYGLPSYTQFNTDIKYAFAGLLKGLDAQLLIAAKFNQGNIYGNPRYEFNKVNMWQYNFVLNYRW